MDTYDKFISLVFAIKIFYIILSIIRVYLNHKGDKTSDFFKNVEYWRERTEFIFIVLMAFLIIYLFNPTMNKTVIIDKETKILFFTFGIILLITSKWSVFFHESKLFAGIQNSLGDDIASK